MFTTLTEIRDLINKKTLNVIKFFYFKTSTAKNIMIIHLMKQIEQAENCFIKIIRIRIFFFNFCNLYYYLNIN